VKLACDVDGGFERQNCGGWLLWVGHHLAAGIGNFVESGYAVGTTADLALVRCRRLMERYIGNLDKRCAVFT
jgi:hypothetical protein